jgi:predicted secreted protein
VIGLRPWKRSSTSIKKDGAKPVMVVSMKAMTTKTSLTMALEPRLQAASRIPAAAH